MEDSSDVISTGLGSLKNILRMFQELNQNYYMFRKDINISKHETAFKMSKVVFIFKDIWKLPSNKIRRTWMWGRRVDERNAIGETVEAL